MSRVEDLTQKNNRWADWLKDGRMTEKQVSRLVLSDIALSLAKIADNLERPIMVEEAKRAPSYYAYYDPNAPYSNRGIRAGRGGQEDDE